MYGSFKSRSKQGANRKEEAQFPASSTVTKSNKEKMTSIKLVPIKIQSVASDEDEDEDKDELDGRPDIEIMENLSTIIDPLKDEQTQQEVLPTEDALDNPLVFDQASVLNDKGVSNITNDDAEDDINDCPLYQAAASGSVDEVKQVLKRLQNENRDSIFELKKSNINGYTPLHIAARFNYKDVIECLLEALSTTTIDQPSGEDQYTPLHIATKYNMTSAAKLLLDRGANVMKKNRYGTTALHFAARRGNADLCRLYLDIGEVNPNVKDNAQVAPLHLAMIGGNVEVVKCLLNAGADPNVEDNEGERPIHYAAAEDQSDLIVKLTKEALKNVQIQEQEKAQRMFINAKSNENDTALHIAAQAGYEDTVKTLISIGASVNVRTDTYQTPLHLAAVGGQIAVVKFLILHAAKVNAVDDQQDTPLHKACQFGRLDTVKYLLSHGANIDAKNNRSFTPLLCAVSKAQDEVVKYLLEKNANPRAVDFNTKNIFHLAIEKDLDTTLKLLLEILPAMKVPIGFLINAVDKDYKTSLHYAATVGNEEGIRILLAKSAQVDCSDNEDQTPIHLAAKAGKLNAIKLLGEAAPGVINATDERGQSPLIIATIHGHKRVCDALIAMGAETSCRDEVNWTPLDYAAFHGHAKIVKLLLDNDAPVDAVDKNLRTPLHHASLKGHVSCINILLDHGASISRQDQFGKNCLEMSAENYEKDACMAFLTHKRWKEALKHVNGDGVHPMEKLIEFAPEVAAIVLDKCITHSKEEINHENYTMKYDFQYLNIHPEEQVKQIYFAPENMVRHRRDFLLSHPLVVKLIDVKFAQLGRWLYYSNLLFYILFLALLTSLLVIDKERVSDKVTTKNLVQEIVPWLTLVMAVFQILKEFSQLYYLRWHYVKDMDNYLEIVLYTSTIIFMGPFIAQNLSSLLSNNGVVNVSIGLDFDNCSYINSSWPLSDCDTLNYLETIKWNAGAIAILLGWSNLLLYLKRFPTIGLYVVMFVEVLKTVVSVLLVFSIFIVAFALSFFVLLDKTAPFSYAGRSFVKTCAMTIGEFDYSDIFTSNVENTNLMPHKVVTFFVFVLFLIMMPILVMNLLVGLSIGDIKVARKNAYLRVLKSQVYVLYALESKYPKWLLTSVYAKEAQYKPNEKGLIKRILGWNLWPHSSYEALKDEQKENAGKEELIKRELQYNRDDIEKQKKRMKFLMELIEEQVETTKLIVEKLELNKDV